MQQRLFRLNKLLDYWSIPHFLFGTVIALMALTFSFPMGWALVATFLIAIGWEFLEMRSGLREARGNSITDVVLALGGFSVTYGLIHQVSPEPEQYGGVFAVAVIIYLAVNFFAWRARLEHDRDFRG
jgi:hypothetical protein